LAAILLKEFTLQIVNEVTAVLCGGHSDLIGVFV
jgi:hypothetical protein